MHCSLKYACRALLTAGTVFAHPALLLCLFLAFPVGPARADGPNRVIFDTDISSDVDDAGAVAVLHALANQGKVDLLAMMVSSGDPWSGPCLDALNTRFGRPDIPVGNIESPAVTHVSKYTQYIAEHFPNDFPAHTEAPGARRLYRKILAAQPASSLTIVSVGYLSNLSRLLESGPDEYSRLDGKTLVLEKVKRLICMGGEFPSGREWNFYQDAKAAANVASQWPTPILFCGFEVGNNIMTGQKLRNAGESHPLREAYRRYNNLTDRQSWDQVTALLATDSADTFSEYYTLSERGRVRVGADGHNTWEAVENGPHRFIVSNSKTRQLAGIIDDLMLSSTAVKPKQAANPPGNQP